MSFISLPPVDQRINSWFQLQKTVDKGSNSKYNVSVTISREFGCEGYPLAEQLKKDFETAWGGTWTIFDRLLLDKIFEEKHVSLELLEKIGDRSPWLDSLLASLNPRWKTDQDLYRILVETIHSLAKQGRAIFVGRGAAGVTQDLENCIHVRLEASLDFRVKSMVSRSKMGVEEAEKFVKEKEDQREKFISHFLGFDLTDISYYHLKMNNEKLSNTEMSQTIKNLIETRLS